MQIIHSSDTQNIPIKIYEGIEHDLFLDTDIYLDWFSVVLSGGRVLGDKLFRFLDSVLLWRKRYF